MATAREIAEKMRKKKEEEKGTTSSMDARQVAEQMKKYNSISTNHVDQKYIDSFNRDANLFLSTAERDYGGLGWANASSSYESRNNVWQDLSRRADEIGAWLYKNKKSIDSNAYDSLNKSLNSIRSGGSSILDSFKSASDYYSQWKTEEAYNSWFEEYKRKEDEKQAVLGAEDFEHYSQVGANIENPTYAQANGSDNFLGWKNPFVEGAEIKNYVTFSRDNMDYIKNAIGSANNNADLADVLGDYRHQFLTDEEVSIYNYYIGKGDNKKAEEYLASLDDTLTQRWSGDIAERVSGNAFLETVFAVNAGLDQFASGITNLDNFFKGTEADPITVSQYANAQIRENIDGVGGVAYDIVQNIAHMAPSMLVGSLTGGFGGALTTGISAAGNAYADMRRLGYDAGASQNYAFLVGASEAALSYAIGGISKLGGGGKGIFQTIGGKIIPSLDNAIARVAIEIGANMGDEFVEEALQEVLDPVFKMVVTGEDFEGINLEEVLYSGLMGALSAGLLEGVPTIAGTAINNYKAKQMYGNGADLVKGSLDVDPNNAYAQKMQAKVDKGKSLSGAQINRIIETNEQSRNTRNIADVVSDLESKGMSHKEAVKTAEWIYKAFDGETYTRKQQKAYLNDNRISDVHRDLFTNEENPVYKRNAEYESLYELAKDGDTDKINYQEYSRALAEADATAEEKASVTENPTTKEVATEGKKIVPEAKVTMTDSEGKTVEVKPQKLATTESGAVGIELENGDIVNFADVDLGDNGKGLVYQAAVDRVESGNFSIDAANVFVTGYNEASGQNVGEYINGWISSYNFGAMKNPPPLSVLAANPNTARLTEEQRETAYNFGKALGNEKAAPKQSAKANLEQTLKQKQRELAIEEEHYEFMQSNQGDYSFEKLESLEEMKKLKAEIADIEQKLASKDSPKISKKGKVIFDGERYGKTLNERQKASLKALGVLAKALNIDIRIFESPLVDGRRQGKNGSYNHATRTMEIDLFAGFNGEATMLFTAAHELTHHIRATLPAKFNAFAEFLFKQYGEKGVSISELIENKIEHLKKNNRTEGMTEEEIYDLAYEEVVADACESFLADGEAVAKIAELKAKDKTLWETIKDFFTKLVARIKAAYEGLSPDSREGRLVAEMLDSAEKLKAMWTEMLVEASKVETTTELLGENGIMVDSKTDSATLYSVRDILSDADRKKVSKALAERFDVTQSEAMDWLKAETSLASLILNPKYSQYLDYTADPNEEAIKSNSDYPQGTVDFSNICKKRRDFTEVMNRVLRNYPNHVFAATDLAKIRTIMEEEGMEVACAICYVEDRRQLDSVVAQNFIDSLALYREGSKTKPDGTPFNANQLKAFSLIEGDTYTPSIYELISLEGRNSLKAKNPAMEEAWVKFNNARGMQSVRLLLNDAEYKRQILKYSPSVVKRKNDLGGLRIYSFSDMEMFHLIDIIQVITDSATVGLSLQGYTKVNEYAKAVKDTGEKLNRSLIPKGDLGYHIEDGRVVLDFDTTEGIDINHPDFFDNIDNPNIGNIVIGINATQIKAAMTSKFIDQIIPFHTGQSNEVLGEKGIAAWDNYKDFQSERDVKTNKKSSHQINIYTEVINAAEVEGNPITNKVDFVNKFLEVCRENNLIPRFSDFLNVDENGNYVYTEGYHKFLVDFKTFDQNTGEYLPQMPVKPIFDNEYITSLLTDYVKSLKAKDAEFTKAMPKVLDRITGEIVSPVDNVKYSESDPDIRYSFRNSNSGMANDALIPYNEEQTRFINQRGDHIIDSFEKLREVVNLAFDQPNMKAIAHFGMVDVATLQKIKNSIPNLPESVGMLFTDNRGYSIATTLDGIRHIVKEKKLTRQDVIDYLDRFADTIVEYDEVDFHYYTRRGRQMPGLLFRKDFPDGKYFSFDLVSQEKQSLMLQSLYIDSVDYEKRKSAGPVLMQNAPASTPKARGGQTSVNSISQDADSVKTKFSDRNFPSDAENIAKEYFGTTNKWSETGWLLKDGTQLDFSGRHWERYDEEIDLGESYYNGKRNSEHYEIADAFPEYRDISDMEHRWEILYGFLQRGNMRIVGKGAVELYAMPTDEQYEKLYSYFKENKSHVAYIGFGDTNSGKRDVDGLTFKAGTDASIIIEGIKDYFSKNRGNQSDLMRFHTMYSDRSPDSVSNRSLLAGALESVAQNDIERNKLKEYKGKIALIEAEQAKLSEIRAQIKELSFAKGPKDTEAIKKLQFDANQAANRINTYDRQLLNLEATAALKGVIQREKQMAYKKAEREGKEALAKYREKAAKTQKELLTRYQESRKKGVEGRRKTEMRHKINKVAHELDALLNRGTKERNVKKGQSALVRAALDLSDMLFATDDELIVGGIVTELSNREKLAVAEFKVLYDEYHSYDESVTENKERRAELRAQMNEKKKALAEVLERERKRISEAKARGIFTALADEYSALKDSKDSYIALAYKTEVLQFLNSLKESVGENVTLKDMTLAQLEDVYKAFSMVKKAVQDSNKIFRRGKAEDLDKRLGGIYGELDKVKTLRGKTQEWDVELPGLIGVPISGLNKFSWNNLRPVDAFERLGSKSLEDLYWDIMQAQGVYGTDVAEVAAKLDEARKKHGYKDWDTKADIGTFKTAEGQEFTLTLREAMSIYAYSKRDQADAHLRDGGFQFEKSAVHKKKGVVLRRKETAHTYRVGDGLRAEIISKLTPAQKSYVDEMQKYITEFGEKGNEVSRILYGMDLFTEEVYFPLFSSKDYISSVKNELGSTVTTASILSQGMTKATKPGANNPIILRGFDDVILEHLDKMSKYHAYAVTIDNLRKVLDSSRENVSGRDVAFRALVREKFGDGAVSYLENYLTDLNGSATMSGAKNPIEGFFGRAKGVAVAANLSVWSQQYFSVIRAAAEINPKYFIPFLGEKYKNPDMRLYAEMKKYAPVTIIKEMGGFDVGSNTALSEYIGYDNAAVTKEKVGKVAQDVFGVGANAMDKLGWITIWAAVKKEVAAKGDYKLGSTEYLKACGERFEQVIAKTQVYDSVNARSGFMRSKHGTVRYLTSFMGEPTVVIGMAQMSIIRLIRNPKSGRAWGSFFANAAAIAMAQAMTSVVKSVVSALRDRDEDEDFKEKYVQALGRNFADDLNPLKYIPVFRDIVSIWEGQDIERPDISLIADAINSLQRLMDSDDDESTADEWLQLALSAANLVGIPLKNIVKDLGGIIRTVQHTGNGYKTMASKHMAEGWGDTQANRYTDLYDAMSIDDKKRLEYYESTYDTEDAYVGALRSSIGDKYKSGEIDRIEARKLLIKYGEYDSNKAYWKLKEWDYVKAHGKDAEWGKYDEFVDAVKTGKNLKAVIKEYTDHGVEKDTLASQITSHYKPLYKKMSGYERTQLKGYLLNAYVLLGYDRAKKSKDIDKWLKD